MYRCFLSNFGYFLDGEFKTIKEAADYGRSKGFEFLIYDDKTIVAVVSGATLSVHICHSEYHNVA
jgi:hypothetical protein